MAEYGEPLTEREIELVTLVATGVTNREIAHTLHISVNTVKVHMRNIFAKLGAESRTEVTMIAVREGWVAVLGAEGVSQADGNADAATPIEAVAMEPLLPWWKRGFLLVSLVLCVATVAATSPSSRQGAPDHALNPQDAPPEDASIVVAPESAWRERAQMPTRRAYLALAVVTDQLYAIGGRTLEGVTGAVEMYDPMEDIWARRSDKPTAVAYVSAAVSGDQVIVPGGRDAGNRPTTISEVYDTATDMWRQITPLPEPRYAYASAVVANKVYLFGGWDGERYVPTTYVYDIDQDRWEELPPMPTPRGFAAAVALNDAIYVIGGYDGERELEICSVFDPESESWDRCPSLIIGRGGLGLVTVGQQIFAIGGGGWTSYLGFNERYNLSDGKWTTIETPQVGEWRSPGVVVLDTTVYAIGGWNNGPLGINEAYEALPFRVFVPVSKSQSSTAPGDAQETPAP